MKSKDQPQNDNHLFEQLLSLFDEERLIRFQRRAEKKGLKDLAEFLKEHRKALEHEAKS